MMAQFLMQAIAGAARRRASGDDGDPDDWLFSDDCEYADLASAQNAEWSFSSGLPSFSEISPIRGGRSLYVNSGAKWAKTPSFPAKYELWMFFEFRVDNLDSASNILILRSDATEVATVQIRTDGKVRIAGMGSSIDSLVTVTTGADFRGWFHYKAGGGADALLAVYLQSDGNSRPSATVTKTTGTATLPINALVFGAGGVYRADSIRVRETEIGDNPLGL
jgi:hypothetical protein